MNARAQALRRTMTDAERVVWKHLRGRRLERIKFKRQVPIGNYVADFAALDLKLIVEIDGREHAVRKAADGKRTQYLEACGFRVGRFWNHDVLGNIEGVLEALLQEITIAG